MHNDEPTLQDLLDRKPLVEEVGEAIVNCSPPQVFGVHGDWGLGKTSFLHQVQWYLTGDCRQQPETATKEKNGQECGNYRRVIQAVWFDAWRYQNEAAPVVALLHEIRAQLSWGRRASRLAGRSAEVAVRGALLSLEDVTKKIGFQHSKFQQANREWEAENLAAALPSHTLREHLRAAIERLLPRNSKDLPPPKLVIFVDDVDRCEPEAAYRLLEGLKIYLTLDNCVFVLGMNQKAIEEAIAKRMKSESDVDPTIRATAYMEKLCQNVWRLPAVSEPEQVLHELLEKTVECRNVRNCIWNAVKDAKHPCLPPNPRRLKGLANLIGRLSARLPTELDELNEEAQIYEARLLMIVAYVYQFHHDLHVRWAFDFSLYEKIREWCEAKIDSNDPPLPFLRSLTLPLQPANPGLADRKPGDFESTFPDPTQANVFWIQPLILDLEQELVPERFAHYLRGVPE